MLEHNLFFILSIIYPTVWSIQMSIPRGLKLGTASSSYQVEGAWNVSDKGVSVLDTLGHPPFHPNSPQSVKNGHNGDVACDSYHNWERDVEMLDEMGVDFYRFSINWPRLLPESFTHYISEDGKNYYNKLIDALLAKGIEPVVTLLHWELPQKLSSFGGWMNPLMVDYFADYARLVFSLYGDRVKTWITMNEPLMICDAACTTGWLPPGNIETYHAPFLCNKHQLLAHAKAWRIYDKEFKPKYGGKVSIANYLMWMEPYTKEDKELTELAMEYLVGRYAHPIYSSEGGWPPSIEKLMMDLSRKQGYKESRLPRLSQEEIELIRGTYDFFGLNFYTSRLVRKARPGESIPLLFFDGVPDLDIMMEVDPKWTPQFMETILNNPPALRAQLAWLKRHYGDLEFFIAEIGFSSNGTMDDVDRCDFIKDHLEQVILSIQKDGVNVSGFTYWSLMDSFEWFDGFNMKFGLYSVDMASPLRTRTPRTSASYMATLIRNRTLLLP